jgi:hypothetical protein
MKLESNNMEKAVGISPIALLTAMRDKSMVHKRNVVDFTANYSGNDEIVEVRNYYFKRVVMFGPKELRFWKATGRISTVANPKRFTKYEPAETKKEIKSVTQ